MPRHIHYGLIKIQLELVAITSKSIINIMNLSKPEYIYHSLSVYVFAVIMLGSFCWNMNIIVGPH